MYIYIYIYINILYKKWVITFLNHINLLDVKVLNIKVEVHPPDYATKADLKGEAGVDISKSDLAT